jgi:glycosyltransferase involved in cell wall biosynthesis
MLRVVSALTGIPYVLHLQDIHPEGAAAIGRVGRGRRFSWLQRADAWACRGAARLATLSDDMAATLRERGGTLPPIDVINNAPLRIDAPSTASLPALLRREPDCPLLLFAGNVGEFQGLDRLVRAAVRLAGRRRFHLVFLGAGAARQRLQRLAGDELGRTIAFLPHVPPEAAAAAMAQADYGVVSLHEGVYRCAFPSKSMMYLAAGCPLLALVEPESELARTVRAADLGCAAAGLTEQDAYEALDRACATAARWTPAERARLQAEGERLYGEPRMLAAWASVFELAAAAAPRLRRAATRTSSAREAA